MKQREIKFRLLSPSKNVIGYEKWYTGSFNKETGLPSADPCWLYSKDGETWTTHQIKHRYKDAFTGLKDKHGKEIFEGDVIAEYQGPLSRNWSVDFNTASFWLVNPQSVMVLALNGFAEIENYEPTPLRVTRGGFEKELKPKHHKTVEVLSCPDLEIIGNIYESPDLLQTA